MSFEETLKRIERKLEKIEIEIKEIRQHILENNTVITKSLISLPDHLRKTARELFRIRQGTASDICKYTKRARAVESGYLNQLERQGFITSFRNGRRKVFLIENDLRIKAESGET